MSCNQGIYENGIIVSFNRRIYNVNGNMQIM